MGERTLKILSSSNRHHLNPTSVYKVKDILILKIKILKISLNLLKNKHMNISALNVLMLHFRVEIKIKYRASQIVKKTLSAI